MSNVTECNETVPAQLEPGSETTVAIILPIIFAIIMVTGVIGNLLVIIVVAVNKHMRSTINILITSLAAADLAFLIIVVPFTAIRYAQPVWPGGDFLCKAVRYVLFSTAWGSIYTLVLMSIVRFIAIVFPMKPLKVLSSRNLCFCIACMWIIVLAANVPAFLHHGVKRYLHECQERSTCTYIVQYNNGTWNPFLEGQKQVFITSFFVFGFLIPLAVICVLYIFILKALTASHIGDSQTTENLRAKKRATYTVFVIVITFVVCWLPLHVILVLDVFGVRYPHVMVAVTFTNSLAFLNSSLNPILYAFLSVNFRKGFQRILLCGRLPKRHLVSTTEVSVGNFDETTSV